MTTVAAPRAGAGAYPQPQAGGQEARATLPVALAFAGGVFMLLTYSQGWEMPLTGENADASQSVLLRTAYFPAYGVALLLTLAIPWTSFRALIRQPFLILIMGIVAASILWSTSPDQTLRRIVANYCTTLSGVVLAARWRWSRLAEVMATAFLILSAFCLFVGLFVPSIGKMTELFPGAWRGLWQEKNALGANMAFAFVVCAAAAVLNPKRRWLWWGAAGLAFLLLLLSTSKTSLVSLLLGSGVMVFIALARRSPASSVASTWAGVVGIGLVASFIVFASDIFLGLLGKDATLTGRTKIWAGVMERIQERPITGYGYGAVWDDEGAWGPLAKITKTAGFRAHHAHNSWLEQWVDLGIFGLGAWALLFLQTWITGLVAIYRERGAYLALPFLVVYSLETLTESVAVTYNDMRWTIFVALAVKLAFPDREQGKPPPVG
ncbi:O-antigen ligase family protein [Caulobacter sp. KR2-114]|uniref:O-antigen ligase family protein n=1 Tax=Caulobacter sp. KR2-114 TaxID=3400912 RepID=UPI003BFB732B